MNAGGWFFVICLIVVAVGGGLIYRIYERNRRTNLHRMYLLAMQKCGVELNLPTAIIDRCCQAAVDNWPFPENGSMFLSEQRHQAEDYVWYWNYARKEAEAEAKRAAAETLIRDNWPSSATGSETTANGTPKLHMKP